MYNVPKNLNISLAQFEKAYLKIKKNLMFASVQKLGLNNHILQFRLSISLEQIQLKYCTVKIWIRIFNKESKFLKKT